MLLINFWQVLVFLVAFWSLKQAKNEGELCVVHGKASWSSITWRIQTLELHSALRSQSSIQGRESEKKSSNQQFRMAMQNFLIACEIKRSFNSCRIESRNEWKKFLTRCKISNTVRNQDATMKEFWIPCKTYCVISRYLCTDSVRFLSSDILCNFLVSPCNLITTQKVLFHSF